MPNKTPIIFLIGDRFENDVENLFSFISVTGKETELHKFDRFYDAEHHIIKSGIKPDFVIAADKELSATLHGQHDYTENEKISYKTSFIKDSPLFLIKSELDNHYTKGILEELGKEKNIFILDSIRPPLLDLARNGFDLERSVIKDRLISLVMKPLAPKIMIPSENEDKGIEKVNQNRALYGKYADLKSTHFEKVFNNLYGTGEKGELVRKFKEIAGINYLSTKTGYTFIRIEAERLRFSGKNTYSFGYKTEEERSEILTKIVNRLDNDTKIHLGLDLESAVPLAGQLHEKILQRQEENKTASSNGTVNRQARKASAAAAALPVPEVKAPVPEVNTLPVNRPRKTEYVFLPTPASNLNIEQFENTVSGDIGRFFEIAKVADLRFSKIVRDNDPGDNSKGTIKVCFSEPGEIYAKNSAKFSYNDGSQKLAIEKALLMQSPYLNAIRHKYKIGLEGAPEEQAGDLDLALDRNFIRQLTKVAEMLSIKMGNGFSVGSIKYSGSHGLTNVELRFVRNRKDVPPVEFPPYDFLLDGEAQRLRFLREVLEKTNKDKNHGVYKGTESVSEQAVTLDKILYATMKAGHESGHQR